MEKHLVVFEGTRKDLEGKRFLVTFGDERPCKMGLLVSKTGKTVTFTYYNEKVITKRIKQSQDYPVYYLSKSDLENILDRYFNDGRYATWDVSLHVLVGNKMKEFEYILLDKSSDKIVFKA